MIKLLAGALLMAATTLAQTTPPAQTGKTTKPMSGTMAPTANSPTVRPTTNTKPLPQTTLKQKLQSGDNAIPTYRMEKDAGVTKGRNRYKRKPGK